MPKYGRNFFVKLSLREALEEVASSVFEDAWLNDEHAVDICFYYFHIQILLLHLYQTCLYIGYACGIRQFLVYGEDCIIISNQDLHAWKVARNQAMPENWLFDYWLFTHYYIFSGVHQAKASSWLLIADYWLKRY